MNNLLVFFMEGLTLHMSVFRLQNHTSDYGSIGKFSYVGESGCEFWTTAEYLAS